MAAIAQNKEPQISHVTSLKITTGAMDPGNLDGSWLRDPVAGAYSVICPPGALGLVLAFALRNRVKSCSVRSWVIPGGAWMSSGGYS